MPPLIGYLQAKKSHLFYTLLLYRPSCKFTAIVTLRVIAWNSLHICNTGRRIWYMMAHANCFFHRRKFFIRFASFFDDLCNVTKKKRGKNSGEYSEVNTCFMQIFILSHCHGRVELWNISKMFELIRYLLNSEHVWSCWEDRKNKSRTAVESFFLWETSKSKSFVWLLKWNFEWKFSSFCEEFEVLWKFYKAAFVCKASSRKKSIFSFIFERGFKL